MTDQSELSKIRREGAATSLKAFARTYLPHHFRLPFSSMHEELIVLLETARTERNARLAIAAPRNYAKSTLVSLAFILWCICYGYEKFIILISNTADQAGELLSTIKEELESNERLHEDFPEAAEPLGTPPAPKRWRRHDIVTRNRVKVLALGAGQKIRGRKHGENRPSLILLDDMENEGEVASADQRETKREWFQKAVMKAGTTAETNVVIVGTLLHYESLLARLLVTPGWTNRKYQAVLSWAERGDLWERWEAIYCFREEFDGHGGPAAALAFHKESESEMLAGAQVLWPERESYLQLMEMRLCEGRASFDSEKQNEPVDPSSCFFDMDQIQYWDDQYASVEELLADLGGDVSLYAACDPSLGYAGRNRDDTAIVVLLRHRPTGILYVIHADIRKRKPLATIEAIIEVHRRWRVRTFAIETNQFQEFLKSELVRISRQKGVDIPVKGVHHSTDKLGRIQSLEPLISAGSLRFSRKHRTLLDELRQYPKAAHDDGPDALQMAVEASRRPRPSITVI